ncbi:NicO-domain-containing protein [Diplocarpon rosae]|nr:NicO-domain-containing protein [Diplocarpon rosae]
MGEEEGDPDEDIGQEEATDMRISRTLASTAALAYTLGLRHALDADHISVFSLPPPHSSHHSSKKSTDLNPQAIDLMTRRLVADGQRPTTVGTFFSLGHSTIVVITSIVVAATAAAVSDRFGSFGKVGGIIGTSVSAGFLIILSMLNVWILWKLVVQLQGIIEHGEESAPDPWVGGGPLFRIFKRLFKFINKPWKMYPLGVLFGLGFDTSSEIALLGIASLQGASGTSFWLILIFPILFTAGMCLLDTTDGALMMTLYTSTALARDQIAILYYSIVLTLITIAAAMAIGVIQLLSLILNVAEPKGKFWDGVEVASDHYDVIGGAICGSFVVAGVASVLCRGAFRRAVDKRISKRRGLPEEVIVLDEGEEEKRREAGESPDKKTEVDVEATTGPAGSGR